MSDSHREICCDDVFVWVFHEDEMADASEVSRDMRRKRLMSPLAIQSSCESGE